jgi:hypothetical protein
MEAAMPTTTRQNKTAAMGAAGLAPLAIALAAGAILPSGSGGGSSTGPGNTTTAVKCEEGIENYHGCHPAYPTGCSNTGDYDAYLNFLKNQEPARTVIPVRIFTGTGDYKDLDSRTPQDLGKSNHAELKDQLTAMGEGQPHAVIGYLYYAKQEGAESSNCELTAPDDTDFHIGIGFDQSVAASLTKPGGKAAGLDKTAVVVEMTPQYRAAFAPEWTLAALQQTIGKQVKVVGQLMADNEHNEPKDNCGLPGAGASCWRASIWEMHPITSFQFCTLDTACAAAGPGWQDLGLPGNSVPAKPDSPAPANGG